MYNTGYYYSGILVKSYLFIEFGNIKMIFKHKYSGIK